MSKLHPHAKYKNIIPQNHPKLAPHSRKMQQTNKNCTQTQNQKIPNNSIADNKAPCCNNHTKATLMIVEQKWNVGASQQNTKVTEGQDDYEMLLNELPIYKSTQQIQPYCDQIYEYVLSRESNYMIDHGYMRNHKTLTFKMRSYLVRHIFKIYNKFSLLRTTLYLAVHYMDMYFSKVYNFRDQFEAVAVSQACLFIAMKYEEIYPPDLIEWVDRRHKDDIIRLEAQILQAFDFQLAQYTLENFLHFNIWRKENRELSADEKENSKLMFLMDLSLFDLGMRQFKPSELSSCLYAISKNRKGEVDRKMVMNVEWMLERNKDSFNWLLDHNYRDLDSGSIC